MGGMDSLVNVRRTLLRVGRTDAIVQRRHLHMFPEGSVSFPPCSFADIRLALRFVHHRRFSARTQLPERGVLCYMSHFLVSDGEGNPSRAFRPFHTVFWRFFGKV